MLRLFILKISLAYSHQAQLLIVFCVIFIAEINSMSETIIMLLEGELLFLFTLPSQIQGLPRQDNMLSCTEFNVNDFFLCLQYILLFSCLSLIAFFWLMWETICDGLALAKLFAKLSMLNSSQIQLQLVIHYIFFSVLKDKALRLQHHIISFFGWQ